MYIKKILIAVAVSALALTLAACGSSGSKRPVSPPVAKTKITDVQSEATQFNTAVSHALSKVNAVGVNSCPDGFVPAEEQVDNTSHAEVSDVTKVVSFEFRGIGDASSKCVKAAAK